MSARNVVLICTDQWRADSLSVLGKPVLRTPFLDQLAQSGAIATRAYSPAPTCVPARMSLLTGLAPASHGRVGYQDGLVFDAGVTMAEAFRDGGYQTQAIGKMHVHPPRNRAGFDNVILHDGYLHAGRQGRPDPRYADDYAAWLTRVADSGAFTDEYENGAHCNAAVAMPWDRPEYQHPTNWATNEAIDWLYRRDPDRPFFLFLSYHRPHAPYNPPQWAFDMYRDKEFPEAPMGNWEGEHLAEFRDDFSPEALVAQYPEDVRQRALAGYFGNMTHLDIQVKRFLEALSDFGVSDDTIVCFTSDHGDMMGDHGMWRKGYPYEGSARIPMIFAGPTIAAGFRSDALMDLTDVPATLLDLAGLPVPAEMDSRSHAAALRGLPVAEAARDYLHGEHAIFGQSLQWILHDTFKYIWWSRSGAEQLFDVVSDPDERVDLLRVSPGTALSVEHADVVATCRGLLRKRLAERPEEYVVDGQLVAGREPRTFLG